MEPDTGRSREWEDVVELARQIDHGIASRKGLEGNDVLRLARAVLEFHGRLASGPAVSPKTDPACDNDKGAGPSGD
ncbi:MAG: hypothetical protein WBY94_12465 [Polyangiaceae bacterium]